MATPPTFTSGEVLTAAQMNAVGLWLVKSQTVGSGVSSVTLSSVFSSDYDNYRIIISGVSSVGANSVYLSLSGRTGSTYAYGGRYFSWGGSDAPATTTTDTGFWLGVGGTNFSASIDLYRPFGAAPCNIAFTSSGAGYGNSGNGYNTTSVSSTAMTVYPQASTLTGGIISVYGYRKG